MLPAERRTLRGSGPGAESGAPAGRSGAPGPMEGEEEKL